MRSLQLTLGALLLAVAGCPARPPPATAGGSAAAAPCDDYVSAICRADGADDDLCHAVGTAATVMGEGACRAALLDVDAARERVQHRRAACRELETRLCADVGEDTESCRVVHEQTPEFSVERCTAMLEEYADVIAELRQLEERNAPVSDEVWARLTAPDAPSSGPADAPVVLVLFSDFRCPFCKMASETVAALREHYAGRPLRIVSRQYPLPMHGPLAHLEAEAVLEAQAQGRFWELSELLFTEQDSLQDRADVDAAAARAGLDLEAFKQAMDAHRWADAVDADIALGDAAAIEGTPTFLLDRERLDVDPRDPTDFYTKLDAALDAAAAPAPTPDSAP